MGNPPPTDRRFNKPAFESMVDLINFTNKTFIRYDQIEADQIAPIPGSESEKLNSTVRIRLAGTGENTPTTKLNYGRLDIGDYIPFPLLFHYETLADAVTLLDQLKELHHIQLEADDCVLVIGERGLDGLRFVTFRPKTDHMVWLGELTVYAAATSHLANVIPERELPGLTLAQVAA